MNTRFFLILLTLVAESTCLGQGNILANGGFESDLLSPWFVGGNYSDPAENPQPWKITSIQAHSGIYSAMDVGNIELRQNFASVATSLIRDVSLWVMQPNGPALSSIYFHYSDAADQFVRLDTHSTAWEFFDVTQSLEANKHLTGISYYGYSSGSPGGALTYLDDFSVTLIPEPSIDSLLLIAIVATVFYRFRTN